MAGRSCPPSFEAIARQDLHVRPPAGGGLAVLFLRERGDTDQHCTKKFCLHVLSRSTLLQRTREAIPNSGAILKAHAARIRIGPREVAPAGSFWGHFASP